MSESISGKHVVVGMSAGLGNAVFVLPTVKALHSLGAKLTLYVQGDFPMAKLFARCAYASQVIQGDARVPVPKADWYVSGHWMPPRMQGCGPYIRNRFNAEPKYPEPEWALALHAAERFGWPKACRPDISDWCRGLDRTPRWDVGLVSGCKPSGEWERKRYPRMDEVSKLILGSGRRVAVFGQEADRGPESKVNGVVDLIGKYSIEALPDALAGCRVLIGTDSGPTQLASSLGVPVVVIYTATSEMKGDPVGPKSVKLTAQVPCRPCQATARWQACTNWICRGIEPGLVWQKADELLKGTSCAT